MNANKRELSPVWYAVRTLLKHRHLPLVLLVIYLAFWFLMAVSLVGVQPIDCQPATAKFPIVLLFILSAPAMLGALAALNHYGQGVEDQPGAYPQSSL